MSLGSVKMLVYMWTNREETNIAVFFPKLAYIPLAEYKPLIISITCYKKNINLFVTFWSFYHTLENDFIITVLNANDTLLLYADNGVETCSVI
jgi:hypothetical protein